MIGALGAVVVAALVLEGCGSTTPGGHPGSADERGAVTVNNVEPVSDLTPSKVTDTAGWKVVSLLFDGLVTFGREGKLIYADAESITPNQDATAYTIKLKPGLAFSDGEPVTARSYARSWSYAANAANGQTGGSIFSGIAGYGQLQDPHGDRDAILSGLSVDDERTLQVRLSAPDSSFPYKVGDISFMPLPSVAYRDMTAFGRHPIGNGPYLFQSWTPNQAIRLIRSPKYHGPRHARNSGITFRDYTDPNTAYADVEAGNLDLLDTVPTSSLASYRKDPRVRSFSQPGPSFRSLAIPSGLAHFQGEEGRLRRTAISHAIDRAEVAGKVFHGSVTPATDFTAPTIAGYSKQLAGSEVLGYDQAKARELWRRADAISAWSGVFGIAYASDSGDKDWVDALIHALHRTFGIEVKSDVFPTAKEFRTAINNRQVHSAFSSGRQSDYPHPEGYLFQGYSSSAADGKGLNYGDYKSEAFDAFLAQAARQTDQSAAFDTYLRAQSQLLHDLPAIPLWYAKVCAVANPAMGHVAFNHMGLPSYTELTKRAG
ncbi:ABC transporter [Bifidobacterium xylocopae]|uniref:ABC transporter n=2 Tax=Bifidobacterium xylocopae TaxID=2493119 RepID=A0A366KDN4_9BIFI|nr:ABC transporter [Bifidobacterium xylocopae]